MRVMVAMSGGVDSSVAAALLAADGHDVVGVTMRLWGGESDTGCCSVSDVDDARRAADALGIEHLVFNFTDDFDAHVVAPYVAAHRAGTTPNPCIECNRKVKFARLSERATVNSASTPWPPAITPASAAAAAGYTLERGADRAKDQSYVVHMLDQGELARTLFPIGSLTKDEVRRRAAQLGLRTATKPDSQDVCFITDDGRTRAVPRPAHPVHAGSRRRLRRIRASGPSRRSSSSPSASARASACPAAARSATSSPSTETAATVVVGDEADLLDDTLDVAAADVGRRPGRRRRARPDERPRHAAPGDVRDDRRRACVALARAAAPRRARPERRVLRPRRPLRARRRHRRLTDSHAEIVGHARQNSA